MGLGEFLEAAAGAGIENAPARDDQRFVGLAKLRDRGTQFVLRRTDTSQRPDVLREESFGIIERLRLNVLAEGKRDRAAFGWIGHHRHRALQRVDDLLGPGDAVEIARDGAKAVVSRNGAIGKILDLLQDGVRPAVGEHVAGQEKERQTVHMRERGSRYHVGGAWADRARHRHEPAAETCLCKGDRGMRHRLLVVGPIGRQLIAHLIKRLAHSGNIAVTEKRPDTRDKRNFLSLDFRHLPHEITGQCLRHCQSDGLHRGVFLTACLR